MQALVKKIGNRILEPQVGSYRAGKPYVIVAQGVNPGKRGEELMADSCEHLQ